MTTVPNIISSTQEESAWVTNQIDDFNALQTKTERENLEIPLNYVIKEEGMIIAGINACFYFEQILYVGELFVQENHRHRRLGSQLLNKVEEEAKKRGAMLVHLDSFDFQAVAFYLKKGYEIFAVLEDCPKGHKRYFMKKVL